MNQLKIGKVTWCDPLSGAFIEELNMAETPQIDLTAMNQVFVPPELMKETNLVKGQLVQFEALEQIATHIEPLPMSTKY